MLLSDPPTWCGHLVPEWRARAVVLGWPVAACAELEAELLATGEERSARGHELLSAVGRTLAVLAVTAEVIVTRDASGQVGAIEHPSCGRGWSAASWARELGIAEHVEPPRPPGLPSCAALRSRGRVGVRRAPAASSHRTAAPAELLWIDCETTGQSAAQHQILELALAATGLDGNVLRPAASVLIGLEPWSARDLRAMAVHGIDWRTQAFARAAKPMRAVLERVASRLTGRRVAGHNVGFDVGFLRASFERVGLAVPPELAPAAEPLCTLKLARMARKRGLLPVEGCSLESLRRHFGVGHQAHRAAGDVSATIEIYRCLRGLERAALARKSA